MPINNPEGKKQHDFSLLAQMQLFMDRGIGFYVPSYFDGKPDLICDDGTALDVKTVDVDGKASMSERKLTEWAEEYGQFVLSLWSDSGMVHLTPAEALERSFKARSRRDGTPVVVIQMGDELERFINPFLQPTLSTLLAPPAWVTNDAPVQMSLDGRAAIKPGGTSLGDQQRELLRVLKFRGGLTSTEAGVLLHSTTGCPGWQENGRYHSPYSGQACCRRAAPNGSTVLYRMRDQGRLWNDGKHWRLYPEDVERWGT